VYVSQIIELKTYKDETHRYQATRPLAGTTLSSLEPEAGAYRELDSPGLYFRVKPNGQKSWELRYKKPDGSDFAPLTLENIEDGQKYMSMGIVAGGRNPVAHEEVVHLRDSGLFTEKDCLDGLSLLSHLLRRLDDA